uniref:RNA-directed DNA polymerase, eukaryota n=1 Tax=Tanacetum cinerariifolium TaxID=118510 RepID=A0A6L2JNL2_TANCI|nr:RNA-directed DNA polymerase, eukaryota [Tanacetum cinerariifolium]
MVKSNNMSGSTESDSIPAIVVDDECLYSKDLSKSLLVRVKEFALLSNLKTALTNEGFVDIIIRYMGELWVLLEFALTKSKELFRDNVGVGSWFSMLRQASTDFTPEGRIVWVEVPELLEESDNDDHSDDGFKEGDPKAHDAGSCGDDSDLAKVPETLFDESTGQKEKHSEDPFGFYPLLNKNNKDKPEIENGRSVNGDSSQYCNVDEVQIGRDGDSANKGSKGDASESVCSGRFKKSEVPRTGGPFLCLMEEVVKVGRIIGYNMEGYYFVMIQGVWLKTGVNLLIVVVYAPHDPRDKRADAFNSFIANAGLEEVHLGGSAFTWCHKSATKMSKLDRNNTNGLIDRYKEELQTLDAIIDKGNGSDEVVNKRVEVINLMQHIDKLHAMDMAQKAKIKWSVDGDENSQFFHGMLNKKRSQLNIRGVMVDGVPKESIAYVDMCYPISLSIEQQEDLERYVSKEELKRVVWDCGTDKSLGPDGFTFGFYRHFWPTIENDVFEAVNHFLTYGDIPKGCNSSSIALILKVPDANLVKDFRPISLIGSIYKIIAKILTNRIVGVLGDIVNEVQSAFIGERQILDSPFILNEVLQWCKLKKKQSLIFKVDFEKAYDLVRWDFLDDVLKKFSFGNKWDDAMFVGQWCDGNINTLVHVLECFYRASGLRINMSKSKIMGVHVEDEKFKHAASKLGCLILNNLFSYLGTKVGESMSRVQAWKEVVDKSFFNGHELGSNKATWVKWNSVLASKEKGGLGVSSLYALNRGLMLKWVWKFFNQKTSLWVKVIKAIHGEDGKVGKDTNTGLWSCWTNIVNEIKILRRRGVNVLDFMQLKVGNGDMTSFWDDNWIGGGVLKDLYPRIYALETCKTVNVRTKLNDSSLDNSFRRRTRGGVEQAQYDALSDLLNSVTLVPMADRWVWSLESSAEFSVASIRKVIEEKRLSIVNSMTRWVKYVPIKVNVLA